jgi:peptidoglycan hydrolase-like protein with peptidoglycan-binding domain
MAQKNIMSKLLKSKILFAFVIFAVVLVVGATSALAYTHTITLKQGMSGTQVTALQQTLNVTPVTGYFGTLTKAAVMAFQANHGLVADGVVGPMTGAALSGTIGGGTYPAGCTSNTGYSTTTGLPCSTTTNLPAGCTSNTGYSTTTGLPCSTTTNLPAGCTSTVGYSPTTGQKCDGSTTGPTTLTGGAGDITVSALSTYGGEQVGQNEEDVKILGFEVEADDNSDVSITSVKVEFNEQDTGDDEDMDAYMESVSVFLGSTKVGESKVDEFSESGDNVFTESISLSNAIIKAGEKGKFYVAVSSNNTLDSGDINSDDWQVGVSAVRFQDGEGVITTVALTLDIDDNVIDDTVEEEFDFASFATAQAVELKVSLNTADDEINEAHIINVESGTTDTDNVSILSFQMKAEGSDITVSDIPVLIATSGEADEAVMLTGTSLWLNGEEIGNETVPTGGAVVFNDLDITIDEGSTAKFVVKVDIQDLTGALDAGDGVQADMTATEVDAIVAEDESGEEIGTDDLTGTANGEESVCYDSGIQLDLVSVSAVRTFTADAAGETDQGEYIIKFNATAFDDNMYIDASTEDDNGANVAGQGIVYDITSSAGTPTVSSATFTASDSETLDQTGGEFWIEDGDSREFTLKIVLTGDATTDGSHEVVLESVNWIDATTAEAAGGVIDADFTNYYTFNLDTFKTGTLFLNDM